MTVNTLDLFITDGVPLTITAADDATPPCNSGDLAALAVITLEFDGSWSGTLTFEGGTLVSGAWVWNAIQATNLNDGTAATTTAGSASTTEQWRVDLAGDLAVRVYGTTVTAGTVDITFHVTRG
jgi:hypothetical protein